jgi:heat shock protein HtpX
MSESRIYQFKALALLVMWPLAFGALGWSVAGRSGLLVAATIAIAACSGIYLTADWLVLRIHGARRIHERHAPGLFRLVRELSRRADLSVPRMYLILDQGANAFATGLNFERSAIAISTGLLTLLDGEELAAVVAHEFGHLRKGDTLLMTALAAFTGTLISFVNVFAWTRWGSSHRLNNHAFLGTLLAPAIAFVVRFFIPSSREYWADEYGARLIGDPSPLARAIRKIDSERSRVPLRSASPATAHLIICNPFSSTQPKRFFETHPSVRERLDRLEALALWRRAACLRGVR